MQEKLPELIVGSALVLGILQFIPSTIFDDVVWQGQPAASVESVTLENQAEESAAPQVESIDTREIVQHVPLPKAVRSIYMSACVAGTPSFREDLVDVINDTEVIVS